MKIYCNREELRKLQTKRAAMVDKYNKEKEIHDTQVKNYYDAYDAFSSALIAEVKELLADELKALPGIKFNVNKMWQRNEYSCVFKITYISPRKQELERARRTYEDKKGFNWVYTIHFIRTDNGRAVALQPKIETNLLVADDLDVLAATYDIFSKIQVINWEAILNKIYTEIPVETEMVTTQNPYLNTENIDKKLRDAQLTNWVGKDVWVKIHYNKSGRDYSPETYYIKPITTQGTSWNHRGSASYFDARYYYTYRNGTPPFRVSQRDYDNATQRTKEFRRNGVTIAQPLELYTTEELFEVVEGR